MEINKELYDKMPIELKKLFKKDEVLELFPESKGQQGDVKGTEPSHTGQNGIYNEYGRVESQKRGDSGSAARFFYCAKASKSDRNEGLDDFEEKSIGGKGNGIRRVCATCGTSALEAHLCECEEKNWINPATKKNNHPTVKPTELMKYLVTLVTPPNGTVLDPFMGSGSTGKAAVRCGFNFVGIELDSDYLDIAKARIEYARDNPEEIKKSKKKKENNTDIKKDLPNDLFE
jgi:site-specific DNA-methyltransferase (adenine-specific)